MVFFNFRGDRALEISEAFESENFEHFDRVVVPDVLAVPCRRANVELARQVALHAPSKLILVDQAETPLYFIDLELRKDYPDLDVEARLADAILAGMAESRPTLAQIVAFVDRTAGA